MSHFVRLSLIALVTLALACGGGGTPEPEVPNNNNNAEPEGPKTTDVVFEYPAVPLTSAVWAPQAMGIPAMWNINIPKKSNLKRQRKIAKKKSASEADLQLLAALLWRDSDAKEKKAGAEPKEAKRKKLLDSVTALRTEARDALRRARDVAGAGKASEITLKLLSVAEMTLADYAAAEGVYKELVDRFPGKGGPTSAKIWLAALYLQTNKNAEAHEVVEGWQVADGLDPRAAYVLAWATFRKRDYAKSNPAIAFALTNWKTSGKRELLEEFILMSATGRAPVAGAADVLGAIVDNPSRPDSKLKWVRRLAAAYELSGHADLASELLAALVEGKYLDPVPFPYRALYRADRAFLEVKNGHPDVAAKLSVEAHKMLAECAAACDEKAKQRLTGDLETYGTLFHTQYALSFDDRYYEPAKALYDYFLASVKVDEKRMKRMRDFSNSLAQEHANPTPAKGMHKEDELIKLVGLRYNTIKACYGAVLTAEPELAGELKVVLHLTDKGDISGVVTEPAKGMQGLPAVGACVEERARRWKFPGRSVAGTTAIKLTFNFSVGSN